MTTQELRGLLASYEREVPDRVLRVSHPVSPRFHVQAVAEELDRRGRHPIVHYERVEGSDVPIVANVLASRHLISYSLGATEAQLHGVYSTRLSQRVAPRHCADPPFAATVLEGEDIDLGALPIPTLFPADAGPYITAGMTVAKDPETGTETMGIHRYQVKGRRRMGVSLHSRRRLFEYQRRAEEQGRDLEVAICVGTHPAVVLASLAYPASGVSKFAVAGGLLDQPLEIAPCQSVDLAVPAWTEIVIEGRLLAGVREDEGPFGEFTGYFSTRSTHHVMEVSAICLRERPVYHCIAGGRAADHVQSLGLLREVEIYNALRTAIPNVTGVSVPPSGCGAFTAFVSIKQTRPGEARHVLPIVFGVDHYLKLVVVVDDDIDVTNDSDVLWALATRVQPERDMLVIPESMGAMLDPSATHSGLTSKVGIDATRPVGEEFAQKVELPDPVRRRAVELLDSLL